MKILIAPDKFKGSLTAIEVCGIVKDEISACNSDHQIVTQPLADGGEGTMELLTALSNGSQVAVSVADPLHRQIQSAYGISRDRSTAFIEMASASGLQLLKREERNCLLTSTFGTGQLIKHALDQGAKKIILGIGGSATNDAGMGMARALGIELIDNKGEKLQGLGKDLLSLSKIDFQNCHSSLRQAEFVVLTDVTNPLHGMNGAAHVFASQKGADKNAITLLDAGLKNVERIANELGYSVDFPGAGAAGGMGAGAKLFLNAIVQSGMEFIAHYTNLENQIIKADLVLTGEGKMDNQTLSGKVVKGVADLAKKYGKKVIAIAGVCELNDEQLNRLGIAQVISLVDESTPSLYAMSNAKKVLRERINSQNW